MSISSDYRKVLTAADCIYTEERRKQSHVVHKMYNACLTDEEEPSRHVFMNVESAQVIYQ